MIEFDVLQATISNMITRIIEFTPRLLTALIILIIGWLISRLLGNLAKKVANRFSFDNAIERIGLADGLKRAQIKRTPSEMLGSFIFWLIFLNFLVASFESLGLSAAVAQLQAIIAYLPRLLSALLALIVGALLAQFIGQLVQAGVASMNVEFHRAIGQSVRIILLIVTVIIAVQQLGLDVTVLTNIVTTLIAIIAAGLALSFGLGGREVARNVLAGHYAREVYSVGDQVAIDGTEGSLEAIGTLNAEIVAGPDRVVVPNTRLVEDQVRIRGRV